MKTTDLEASFEFLVKALKLPKPEREYRFCPARRWRADFCWPKRKLIIECEGGIYRGGGHNSITGFEKDIEKYNWATIHGWKVIRYTTNTMNNFIEDSKLIFN